MTEVKKSAITIRKKLISRLRKRGPWFRRYHWFKYSLPDNWRSPRGLHSKMRRGECSKPRIVKTGYRSAKIIRGLHPSGYEEIYVCSIRDLQKIDKVKQAARLSSGIGQKKRAAIITKANAAGIKILNA